MRVLTKLPMTAVLARIHPLSKGLFQGHLTVSNMSGRGGGGSKPVSLGWTPPFAKFSPSSLYITVSSTQFHLAFALEDSRSPLIAERLLHSNP